MKATGIVRRIDDLGRVVIPKEIRRTQLIRVGDPLEIYVSSNNEVIFKKYSPLGEMTVLAQSFCDVLAKSTGIIAVVSDRDHVIAAPHVIRELVEKRLTKGYENMVELRRTTLTKENPVLICEDTDIMKYASAVAPVICHGDIIGSVAFVEAVADEQSVPFAASAQQAAAHIHVAASVLGRQMED